MSGNSFATEDGAHVVGSVAMAINDKGVAVPVTEKTQIGTVRVEGLTVEQLCRALAAHAALLTGKSAKETYKAISGFVGEG